METNETGTGPTRARRLLPWLVAAGAFLFYLFTLNWWFTLPGLGVLPRAAGWDWEPTYAAPLLFLVNLPVRWLPAAWQIPALNLIACLCAALTLGLLARCVMLMPHDRTREQRQLERHEYSFLSIRFYWVPPLLAVLVCALQYSFWQHAIVNTGEALDLLCFAYVLRCLLEARVDERDSWLTKMALVYGLAITNNYAMIGFLPLVLGALIWIKGTRLLESGIILQIILCGLAGLLCYFLLPAINLITGRAEESFWEMLRINLGNQRMSLTSMPRYIILLVALSSILPVIFIGIRWPAQFGDISAAGNALTNLMTHVIHGVFLVACLYVAFDPPFSPRFLAEPRQMLPFYFLGALSIGYFTGYFLLLFGQRPRVKTWQRPSPLRLLVGYTIVGLIALAAVGVPAGLFVQNRPEILTMSQKHLQKLGNLAAASLPKERSLILSDDPHRIYALEAGLAKRADRDLYVVIHTGSLPNPAYHRYLRSRYGERWPEYFGDRPLSQRIDPKPLVEAVIDVAKTGRLYYLHPSFGYYFEFFYAIPQKMLLELHPYETNKLVGRKMTSEEVALNSKFWMDQQSLLDPMRMETELPKLAKNPPDRVLYLVGAMYSRTLNAIGVASQLAGELKEAGILFTNALSVNAYNPYAYINQEFNRKLQAGVRTLQPTSEVRDRLARYKFNFNAILNENGPVDEPNNCFILAEVLARGRNYRQAAQLLMRTLEFQPDNFPAQVGLSTMMVRAGLVDQGVAHLQYIRDKFPDRQLPEELAITQAEAWALSKLGKLAEAVEMLHQAQQAHPEQAGPYVSLAEIYLETGQVTNALATFEKQIQLQPQDPAAKINYYALQIQLGQYKAAIEGLSRFLTQNPTDERGRLNRAIAYFLSGELDQAEADYRTLYDAGSPPFAVYYGLGEISFRRGKKKEAEKFYQLYLNTAPRETPEFRKVEERVKSWNRGIF